MAIVQRTTWKVRSGRGQDFLANVATAKRILERLGGRVRVLNQAIGTNAPCFLVVVESPDWRAYGELQASMQTDSEWQGFFNKVIVGNLEPSADLIDTALSSDVPLG